MSDTLKNIGWLVLAAIIAGGYGYYKYGALEKETRAYALDSAKAIVSTWNPEELQNRMHVTLQEEFRTDSRTLDDYFTIYRKLGAFTRLSKCDLEPTVSSLGFSFKEYTVADYVCEAEFKNSDAIISISVRQDDAPKAAQGEEQQPPGPWQIVTFRVESPIFTRQ